MKFFLAFIILVATLGMMVVSTLFRLVDPEPVVPTPWGGMQVDAPSDDLLVCGEDGITRTFRQAGEQELAIACMTECPCGQE